MGRKRDNAMKAVAAALIILAIPVWLLAKYERMELGGIEFVYRLPAKIEKNARVMVVFGGRNWPGEKTIKTFNFDKLADKHSLILLSPSFKDDEYWQPEKWSGKLLLKAVEALNSKCSLPDRKLLFYGYSAGGQCANLFYNYMPERVEAWGLHACGVYPQAPQKNGAPAFATCGLLDSDRVRISKIFIYKYRELGGNIIWKTYAGGHELNGEALDFARQFFDDILGGSASPICVGEDETMLVLPPHRAREIDIEFRNPLYSEKLKKLWEER